LELNEDLAFLNLPLSIALTGCFRELFALGVGFPQAGAVLGKITAESDGYSILIGQSLLIHKAHTSLAYAFEDGRMRRAI
jgi:hypothetical protein